MYELESGASCHFSFDYLFVLYISWFIFLIFFYFAFILFAEEWKSTNIIFYVVGAVFIHAVLSICSLNSALCLDFFLFVQKSLHTKNDVSLLLLQHHQHLFFFSVCVFFIRYFNNIILSANICYHKTKHELRKREREKEIWNWSKMKK